MLNAASSTDENVTPASAARALIRSHRGRSSVTNSNSEIKSKMLILQKKSDKVPQQLTKDSKHDRVLHRDCMLWNPLRVYRTDGHTCFTTFVR